MTHNIFEKITYHLKTIVHCPPSIFYSRKKSFSNQLEVNNNNYSAKGFQNVYMYGRDK